MSGAIRRTTRPVPHHSTSRLTETLTETLTEITERAMTAYGQPPGEYQAHRPTASPTQRAALLSYVAAGLGVLSFIWGFLTWYTEGQGEAKTDYGGYALATQGSALIGLSLAAGLIALVLVLDKRGAGLVPAAVAAAGVLVAVGQLAGHGMIGVPKGAGEAHVGIGIGLILALVTVVLQLAALVLAWMMASGRMPAPRPRQQQYQQQYGQQYGQPSSYGPQPGQPAAPYYPQQPVEQPHPGQPVPPGQPEYGARTGQGESQQPAQRQPAQPPAQPPPPPYQQQPPQGGQYPPPATPQ
jgi:hypothetical protein